MRVSELTIPWEIKVFCLIDLRTERLGYNQLSFLKIDLPAREKENVS